MPNYTGEFVNCDICGGLFYVPLNVLIKNQHHYCSRKCYSEGRTKFNIDENGGNWSGGKINTLCSYCGRSLTIAKHKEKNHKYHYCSKECLYKHSAIIRSGENASNWQGGKIETKCDFCGTILKIQKGLFKKNNHHFCNIDCRALFNRERIKINCSFCGKEKEIWPSQKKDSNFCNKKCSQKFIRFFDRVKYGCKNFRSGWEANFAKWCDGSGIEWKYESQRFELGNTAYIPDFYLPEFDLYIEIKGYWRDDARLKFIQFKKQYPDINIEIFDQPRLLEYGVIKK